MWNVKKIFVTGYARLCLLFFAAFTIAFSSYGQLYREKSQILGIDEVCLDDNLMSGGVVFFDYNQDKYSDIYVIGGQLPNALYRNNWDGTFTDVSGEAGVALPDITTVGAAVGDIDNDGDEDLFVTTTGQFSSVLLMNNGDGTFKNISNSANIKERSWSTSATFGDFNLDGWVDIYVNNYAAFDDQPFAENITGGLPNYLYQNMGDNTFREVASSLGLDNIGCGLAVTFTDCDSDGDPDLYVANDFGLSFEPNELYMNMYPEPEFEKTASMSGIDAGINAMGIAVGDYDEDGDFDYYVTNIGDNPFFENLNNGILFKDIGLIKHLNNDDGTSWGTAFVDYDNDTYLDLLVANGEVIDAPHQNNENRLFKGDASTTFVDISVSAGIASTKTCRGLSYADIDNDGDLDVMFGVVTDDPQSKDHILIYENLLENSFNWLQVNLEGTSSHRNGYGSHLRVVIGDRSLAREADGGSSYLSHSTNKIHFGLGNYAKIDSLIVTWPGGNQDIIKHIDANSFITVVENTNWFINRHEELSIVKGDSIFLSGAFRSKGGIYYNTIPGTDGLDSLLIITKLKILDNSESQEKEEVNFSVTPNPFNINPKLEYTLVEKSEVKLSVIDLMGRNILMLEDIQPAGRRTFDFDQGKYSSFGYSSGLLIFQLIINNKIHTVKAWKLNH